jgi:hypothetical protein
MITNASYIFSGRHGGSMAAIQVLLGQVAMIQSTLACMMGWQECSHGGLLVNTMPLMPV